MERRQSVELVRILSAFGIVWFHTSGIAKDVAYSGLIVFLIVSMYFPTVAGTAGWSWTAKAKRILVPWGAWFFLYGLINLWMGKQFVAMGDGVVSALLAGPQGHLWYMPFIFAMQVLLYVLMRALSPRRLAYACALGVMSVFLLASHWRTWVLPMPYPQYAHAFSGILIGIFLGSCASLSSNVRIVLMATILMAAVSTLSERGVGVPYVIGFIVASVALLPTWRLESWTHMQTTVANCTLGIYFSHPLLHSILQKSGLKDFLWTPVLVFFASLGFVLLLRSMAPRASRYIV